MTKIKLNEDVMTSSKLSYTVKATKATFRNKGNVPVYVDATGIPPGAEMQVCYDHPHIFEHNFKIRFDTSATPVSSTIREELVLENGPYLIIQTMTPECQ